MEWRELVTDSLTLLDTTLSKSNKLGCIAQGIGKNIDGSQQTQGTDTITIDWSGNKYIGIS